MHPADKAVLRLAIGTGPGRADRLRTRADGALRGLHDGRPAAVQARAAAARSLKGVVVGLVVGGLLAAGVLMVPILENYAVTGVMLTGVLLYAVYFAGARSAQPADDHPGDRPRRDSGGGRRRAGPGARRSAWPWPWGSASGVLVSGISHALLSGCSACQPAPASVPVEPGGGEMDGLAGHAGRHAGVRARADQPCLLSAGHHEDGALGPAGRFDQTPRSAGRELVGSTLMGGRHGACGLARPVDVAEPVDADAVDGGCRVLGGQPAVRRPADAPRRRRSGAMPW